MLDKKNLKVEYSRTNLHGSVQIFAELTGDRRKKGMFLLFDSWSRGESSFPLMDCFVRQLKTSQETQQTQLKVYILMTYIYTISVLLYCK